MSEHPISGWSKLSAAQRADIEAHVNGLTDDAETYDTPRHGWTCFHCGETFRTEAGARLHFGEKVTGRPVCFAIPAGRVLVTTEEWGLAVAGMQANGRMEKLLEALRLALPILDDDLESYRGDTPPRLMDARGFVCLDDLSCDHDRWKCCEATLNALLVIRPLLPANEWAESTYETTQAAVEHFALSKAEAA